MNNLFKGCNSKFVVNLFKSLSVACTVVVVDSCDADRGLGKKKIHMGGGSVVDMESHRKGEGRVFINDESVEKRRREEEIKKGNEESYEELKRKNKESYEEWKRQRKESDKKIKEERRKMEEKENNEIKKEWRKIEEERKKMKEKEEEKNNEIKKEWKNIEEKKKKIGEENNECMRIRDEIMKELDEKRKKLDKEKKNIEGEKRNIEWKGKNIEEEKKNIEEEKKNIEKEKKNIEKEKKNMEKEKKNIEKEKKDMEKKGRDLVDERLLEWKNSFEFVENVLKENIDWSKEYNRSFLKEKIGNGFLNFGENFKFLGKSFENFKDFEELLAIVEELNQKVGSSYWKIGIVDNLFLKILYRGLGEIYNFKEKPVVFRRSGCGGCIKGIPNEYGIMVDEKEKFYFKDKDEFFVFLTSLMSIEWAVGFYDWDFEVKWDGKSKGRCVINGNKEFFCLSENNVNEFASFFYPFYSACFFNNFIESVEWGNGEIKDKSCKIVNKIMKIDIKSFNLSNEELAKKFFGLIGGDPSGLTCVVDDGNRYWKVYGKNLYFPFF